MSNVAFRCDRPHTNHRSDHGNLLFAAYWSDPTTFLPQMASLPYVSVQLSLSVIIPFLVDAVKWSRWLYLLDWWAFTIRLSVQSVIVDDSSVSESHTFLQAGLQKGGVSLWTVTLLDCHKQLLDNSSLFIGNKRRTMLESYKDFWRQKYMDFVVWSSVADFQVTWTSLSSRGNLKIAP